MPCARTLHGEAPTKETINKPSPKPNNDKPKHKKNNVENLGLKLNGLLELQYVFGIFFIDKNIQFRPSNQVNEFKKGCNFAAFFFENNKHACDFKIKPSLSTLRLLSCKVFPVELMSVIISDEPIKG